MTFEVRGRFACHAPFVQAFLPVALGAVFIISVWACRPASPSTLARISDVLALTSEEANRAYPVHLRGNVTFYDAIRQSFILQDESGSGITIDHSMTTLVEDLYLQEVEIEGFTRSSGTDPIVINPSVFRRGLVDVPEARPVSVQQLASREVYHQWVALLSRAKVA